MIDQNWKDVMVYSVLLLLANQKTVYRTFVFEADLTVEQIKKLLITKLPNVKCIQTITELELALECKEA